MGGAAPSAAPLSKGRGAPARDWHQLIEMCGMVDTLLIDHEAIYDPRRPNDRLLLGRLPHYG